MKNMKEKVEGTMALIVWIGITIFLIMALTVKSGSTMNPVEQQINDESIIM